VAGNTSADLVGHWKLDDGSGTIATDSVDGYDGTLIGDTAWVAKGKVGRALQFDGNGDYVDCGNDPVFNPTGSFSIALWAYISDWGSPWGRSMIGKGGDQDRGGWSVRRFQDATIDFCGSNLTGDGSGAEGQNHNMNSNTAPPINEWFHIACVYDVNNMAYIYINGVVDRERATTGTVATTDAHLYIGTRGNTAGTAPDDWSASYFNGMLDDVRYYDHAMTADEVSALTRTDPTIAWKPKPAHRATLDIGKALILSWSPGLYADKHYVYFGTNYNDVNDAKIDTPDVYRGQQDANSYTPPEAPQWGQTYYWRIDEYNTDATVSRGDVWSIQVADYLIVDNFEDYNDFTPDKIFQTWRDGQGFNEPAPGYPGNETGSAVGSDAEPWAEQDIINSGSQSMPFKYINDGSTGKAFYSEIFRDWNEPQDWTIENVKSLALWFRGYPATVGSYTYNVATSTFTVTGNGVGIAGTADEFHYVYKKLTGTDTADIIAKVLSIDSINQEAKAGVMIRDSLDADSTNAFMCLTQNGRMSFQARTEYKGSTLDATGNANTITLPYWVRLLREFNAFTAYYSTDGTNWVRLPTEDYNAEFPNPQGVPMADPVYIGLAFTSGVNGIFGEAVFSNVQVVGNVSGEWKSRDVPSNDAAPLYIAVEDSSNNIKVIEHPNPDAVQLDEWTEWPIDLAEIEGAGVDIKNITTMYIGIGDRDDPVTGGFGKLYIDDIRLHRSRCVPEMAKPVGDLNDDCVVDYLDLQIMTNNWLISGDYEVTPVAPSDANLVAYYAFENNLLDGSGNGNHGDPCGAPVYVPGKIGSALELDGIEDYVDCGNAVIFDMTDKITLSVWVKTNDTGNGEHNPYVTKGDTAYGIKHFTSNSIEFFVFDSGEWYQARSAAQNGSFNGIWHYLAGTYDGSQIKLYIDGILQAVTDHIGSIATNTFAVNIGRNSETTDRFYAGVIDEVRIYNRVLSQAEIGSLAGRTAVYTQPLYLLLSPQDSAIDMNSDSTIDLKDYALMVNKWLDELLWP
jgi:hypothetical protein